MPLPADIVSPSRRYFFQSLPIVVSSLVGATAGAVTARPSRTGARDFLRLSDFLGDNYDPDVHDAGLALERAVRASSETRRDLIVSKRIKLSDPVNLRGVHNASIVFEDSIIDVFNQNRHGVVSNRAVGPICLLFQQSRGIRVSGQATLRGHAQPGTSRTAGIVIDSCQDAVIDADLRFERLAAGLMLLWSTGAEIRRLTSFEMNGRQTFGEGTAGSTLVISGSSAFRIGSVHGDRTRKPVVYLSVAPAADGRRTDNSDGSIDTVSGTGLPGSTESCLLALRSARNCRFGTVAGENVSMGLYLVRYDGDHGYSVDANTIGAVTGSFPSTGASVDAAVVQEIESPGLMMGANTVHSIDVRCGGEFGILVGAGAMTIGAARVEGGVRPLAVRDASLSADEVTISDQDQEAVALGRGASLQIRRLSILSGSRGGVSGAVRYMPELGGHGPLGRVHLETVDYAHNQTGVDVLWVYFDYSGENSADSISINNLRGKGSRGETYFGGPS